MRLGLVTVVVRDGASLLPARADGVKFLVAPRDDAYGRVAVFMDVAGTKWHLIGPLPAS